MNRFIITLILIISIVSCSKKETYTITETNGIKTYKNKNTPSNQDMTLDLKELYTIDFNKGPHSGGVYIALDVDKNNNTYILDLKSSKVHKYDSKGKFIKSFVEKGSGPGEAEVINGVMVKNDTVYVASNRVKKLLKYDLDGNHLGDKISKQNLPAFIKNCGDSYTGYFHKVVAGDEKTEIFFNLALADKNLEEYKFLVENEWDTSKEYRPLDLLVPFGVSENTVFAADISTSEYKINVFDSKGNKKYNIRRSYMQTPFSDEERKEGLRLYNYVPGNTPSFPYKNKKAVNFVIPENDEWVWVVPSVKRDDKNRNVVSIDIYKNGIFMKRLETDKLIPQDFSCENLVHLIKNNRFFQMSADNGELRVFEIVR